MSVSIARLTRASTLLSTFSQRPTFLTTSPQLHLLNQHQHQHHLSVNHQHHQLLLSVTQHHEHLNRGGAGGLGQTRSFSNLSHFEKVLNVDKSGGGGGGCGLDQSRSFSNINYHHHHLNQGGPRGVVIVEGGGGLDQSGSFWNLGNFKNILNVNHVGPARGVGGVGRGWLLSHREAQTRSFSNVTHHHHHHHLFNHDGHRGASGGGVGRVAAMGRVGGVGEGGLGQTRPSSNLSRFKNITNLNHGGPARGIGGVRGVVCGVGGGSGVLRVSHRWLASRREGPGRPSQALSSADGARDFVYQLVPAERKQLLTELQSFEQIAQEQAQIEPEPPSRDQLKCVMLHNAIPFIGFGFLDNAIMISAGANIEMSVGVTFGISTMAAAAMGNLVSDLAGLGLAGYVETLAGRFGLPVPNLSPKQADAWQTRLSAHTGRGVGVTLGCILGMFPLLLLSGDTETEGDPGRES